MNGISPDGDTDDVDLLELESVVSDNISETRLSGGGTVRKKTSFSPERDSLLGNGEATSELHSASSGRTQNYSPSGGARRKHKHFGGKSSAKKM